MYSLVISLNDLLLHHTLGIFFNILFDSRVAYSRVISKEQSPPRRILLNNSEESIAKEFCEVATIVIASNTNVSGDIGTW